MHLSIRSPPKKKKSVFIGKMPSKQHMTKQIQTNIPKSHFTRVTNTYGWDKKFNYPKLHLKSYNQIIFNIIPSASVPWKVAIHVLKTLIKYILNQTQTHSSVIVEKN